LKAGLIKAIQRRYNTPYNDQRNCEEIAQSYSNEDLLIYNKELIRKIVNKEIVKNKKSIEVYFKGGFLVNQDI